MTSRTSFLVLSACALVLLLPSAHVQSQLAAPPADSAAALRALHEANADLIKRQDATLKELTEMTESAREVRIYSRRG